MNYDAKEIVFLPKSISLKSVIGCLTFFNNKKPWVSFMLHYIPDGSLAVSQQDFNRLTLFLPLISSSELHPRDSLQLH